MRLDRTHTTAETKVFEEAEPGWLWVECVTTPGYSLEEARLNGLRQIPPPPPSISDAEKLERDRLRYLRDISGLTHSERLALDAWEDVEDAPYTADQKAECGVMLYVEGDGTLVALRGLSSGDSKATRSEANGAFSQKVRADLEAIELAAVQTALLRRPDLLLDVLGFILSREGPLKSSLIDMRSELPVNEPSDEDPRFTLDQRLNSKGHPGPDRSMKPRGEADMFKIFRGKGIEHRDSAISAGIAQLIRYSRSDRGLYALLAREAEANMRDVWTPTAVNFFRRVRTGLLDQILEEALQLDARDSRMRAWRKMKKAEKAAHLEKLMGGDDAVRDSYKLSPAIRRRLDRWTPEGFGRFATHRTDLPELPGIRD